MNKNVKTIEFTKKIPTEAAAAERLFQIRSIIKDLQAEEKALKQSFLDMDTPVYDAGDYLVSVISKERNALDQKSLAEELGDRLKSFMKKTAYKTVSVSRK